MCIYVELSEKNYKSFYYALSTGERLHLAQQFEMQGIRAVGEVVLRIMKKRKKLFYDNSPPTSLNSKMKLKC